MKRNSALFLGLLAIAVVVWSVSGDADPEPPTNRGAALYQDYCYRCHGSRGEGGDGRYPIRNKQIWSMGVDTVITTIAFGASGSVHPSANGARKGMPPAPYSDAEIAEVTMFVMQTIANRTVTVTAADVARVKLEFQRALRVRLNTAN